MNDLNKVSDTVSKEPDQSAREEALHIIELCRNDYSNATARERAFIGELVYAIATTLAAKNAEIQERRTAMADIVRILGFGCAGLENPEIAKEVSKVFQERDQLKQQLEQIKQEAKDYQPKGGRNVSCHPNTSRSGGRNTSTH